MTPTDPNAPAHLVAHLFGGPLDGHLEPGVPVTTEGLCFTHGGSYTYCPHATAHFRGVPTFIHQTLSHDFFHPNPPPP